MRLYPAIDILDGNAVRLVRGDFDAKTVYESDPLAAARAWVQAGARQLHVVDLDGARGREGVTRVDGLGVEVTAHEAHRVAVEDVYRRIEPHRLLSVGAAAHMRAKFASRRSPAAEDFSG